MGLSHFFGSVSGFVSICDFLSFSRVLLKQINLGVRIIVDRLSDDISQEPLFPLAVLDNVVNYVKKLVILARRSKRDIRWAF